MKTYRHMLIGPVTLEEDTLIKGMVTGDLVVESPANAVVEGMVTGQLIIEQGASADVSGIVRGGIIDKNAPAG